jgi:hypothetical protein
MNHGGREGRKAGLNKPAVEWFEQTYLPGQYDFCDDIYIYLTSYYDYSVMIHKREMADHGV